MGYWLAENERRLVESRKRLAVFESVPADRCAPRHSAGSLIGRAPWRNFMPTVGETLRKLSIFQVRHDNDGDGNGERQTGLTGP
jgi:hypothetical protein